MVWAAGKRTGGTWVVGRVAAMARFHHVAIRVPHLRDAEAHYQALLDARVAFREVLGDDGWMTFPDGSDWPDFDRIGVAPQMSALRVGSLEVTLIEGESSGSGSLDHLAVLVSKALFGEMADRAVSLGCTVEHRSDDYVMFVDRYGIGWEISPDLGRSGVMKPVGARTGRWVDIS